MSSDDTQLRDISGSGVSYGELPEEEINICNKKGSGGVQFRSRTSIEEVRRISRVSNYDIEEIVNYWGDSEEHVLRKSELKSAVKDMYYNKRVSDSDFTTLGLDDKAGQGRAVRKVNKALSRNAVMDEQCLQHHEGVQDDELLADVYAITTVPAKREAQMKAQRLHEEIDQADRLKADRWSA